MPLSTNFDIFVQTTVPTPNQLYTPLGNRRQSSASTWISLFNFIVSSLSLLVNILVNSLMDFFPADPDDSSFLFLILKAFSAIQLSQYVLAFSIATAIFIYNFLECHVIGDVLRGLRGDRVVLTYNPLSEVYSNVVSKCRNLHGRYLVTPWLASPHLQTIFVAISGRPPAFQYKRQLYDLHDGQTIALDWLLASDVASDSARFLSSNDDSAPIVIIIPGLTSDSNSPYIKHIVYAMAKHGWNVVVENHRGLGGISLTSDCFYNAGRTKDLREIVFYLHRENPTVPLFAIGTSIGANILVKYLGEEGNQTPLAGAVSVCSPYDLLVCNRFLNRKLVQRLYDRGLAVGIKGYAKLHQTVFKRITNWDEVCKSCYVREFDTHATCLVEKYETADVFYRQASCVNFIGGVSIPLLCISALDDPVCTSEAIPWDECKANKNIVLATLPHGGHLAFFKGITACNMWWIGAVTEFLSVLYSSHCLSGQQQINNAGISTTAIDNSSDVDIGQKEPITAAMKDSSCIEEKLASSDTRECYEEIRETDEDQTVTSETTCQKTALSNARISHDNICEIYDNMAHQVKKSMKKISLHNGRSMWLLVYISIITTWPLLGSALLFISRRKQKGLRLAS